MKPKETKFSKDEIVSAIVNDYFDDFEFIEKLNNLTWFQKSKLRNHERKNK